MRVVFHIFGQTLLKLDFLLRMFQNDHSFAVATHPKPALFDLYSQLFCVVGEVMTTALPCVVAPGGCGRPCAEMGLSRSKRRQLRSRRVAVRHAQKQSLALARLLTSSCTSGGGTTLRRDAEEFVPVRVSTYDSGSSFHSCICRSTRRVLREPLRSDQLPEVPCSFSFCCSISESAATSACPGNACNNNLSGDEDTALSCGKLEQRADPADLITSEIGGIGFSGTWSSTKLYSHSEYTAIAEALVAPLAAAHREVTSLFGKIKLLVEIDHVGATGACLASLDSIVASYKAYSKSIEDRVTLQKVLQDVSKSLVPVLDQVSQLQADVFGLRDRLARLHDMSPAKRDIGLDSCADNFQRLDGGNGDTDTAAAWNCTNSIDEVDLDAHDDSLDFVVGDAVVLVNLLRQPTLNGQYGEIIGWDDAKCPFQVRVAGGTGVGVKLLMPFNLKLADW